MDARNARGLTATSCFVAAPFTTTKPDRHSTHNTAPSCTTSSAHEHYTINNYCTSHHIDSTTLLTLHSLARTHHPTITTMTATQIFTIFAGILALVGAYFYFFGIDPETKRELERKALQTMGENKMSYMAKGTFHQFHSDLHALTHPRPNQQDPQLRPRRHQEPQEESRQCRRRCHQQPYRRASW